MRKYWISTHFTIVLNALAPNRKLENGQRVQYKILTYKSTIWESVPAWFNQNVIVIIYSLILFVTFVVKEKKAREGGADTEFAWF